jgi:glycosyltransferase involved in cell wall biosynthesis
MATAVRQVQKLETNVGAGLSTCKPRILFLIDEIGNLAGGGTERQVLQLIGLSKRLGYAPRLAVLRGTEWLNDERAGCPVYLARANSLFRPAGWRACLDLVRWMRRERITLVQTFFIECNVVGPWLARLAGVSVVIGSRRNLNQWMGPTIRQIQRLANLSTDCIVANSVVTAESIRDVEQVPQRKVRIAYNGIDAAKFAGLDRQRLYARRRLEVADGDLLVGNISCLRSIKGIHQFVDAARLVLEKDPYMRFVVVGDGMQYAEIAERICRYGLEDRVQLAGAQTDVLPYLAAMDIGVLSSLAEGFSNSLLEYMASGLPAVATDVGGNREALGDTGILVPPDDPVALAEAILRLREPALRQQFGQAALQRVERFSLMRAERCMEEIYGQLLSSKKNLRRKN